jgi:hypothetical protein
MADPTKDTPAKPAEPAKAAAPKPPREVPGLQAIRRTLAEQRRNIWHIEVDAGIEPNEMLAPSYWAHVAREFRQADRIEAHAEDGAWFAEFLVQDAGTNWAKVACLRAVKLETINPDRRGVILPGHTVGFGGNFAKWRVVRDVDKHVLRDKFPSEGDAFAWLSNYAKTVATT